MSNIIDMNNRRQYTYLNQQPQPYRIETLNIADGDVIILHLSKDLDLDDINSIRKEIQQYFPNNQVICANEHILESITILKKEKNPFALELDLGELQMDWKDLVHK